MTSERLLANFSRIADAPDAIPKLRRFIIDLGVRGQLVPQDKAWRTVNIEQCLEVLSDSRFIHQGWSPQCESNRSPSDKIWGVLKTTAIQDGFYLEEQNKELPKRLEPKSLLEVRKRDILITCAGPRARCGIACLVEDTRERLIISGKMYRFRANEEIVASEYLTLFLRARPTQAAIDKMKTGSSESGLNLTQDRFRTLQVRFGTVEEQRRIIAKIDELMDVCDELEKVRAYRETQRHRLTVSGLSRLNAPNVETFRDDARLVLNALPALTARSDQIKQLRKTILNLAVRGKLALQDPKDEPAAVLLKRIANETSRARRPTVRIIPAYDPYPLPVNWRWATLGELIVSGPQNGISPKPTSRGDAPMAITLTATTSGSFNPIYFKRVEANIPAESEFWLKDGDLLFQRGNTREYVGMAAVYEGPANSFLFPDLIIKVRVSDHLSLRYVHLASISSPARAFLSENASGAQPTMPKINQSTLLSLPLPVPPIAEQHRIVTKVEELMALCDELETNLIDTADIREHLLDAFLAEALEPAEVREAMAVAVA
jgi:type I restriction enzyme S subunit